MITLKVHNAKMYSGLAILGFVVPFIPFVEWLFTYGFDPVLFWTQLTSHQVSLFAWLDVVIAAVVVYCFTFHCREQLSRVALLSVVLSTSVIGVSCGLPLLLYFLSANADDNQAV